MAQTRALLNHDWYQVQLSAPSEYNLLSAGITQALRDQAKNIYRFHHKKERVYGTKFVLEERDLILLRPCGDGYFDPVTGENLVDKKSPSICSMSLLLKWIKTHQKRERAATLFIPLAEQRWGRLHWTLLVIHNNQSYFFDPKTSFSLSSMRYCMLPFYSIKHIQEELKAYFPLPDQNIHYLSIQRPLDSYHCGYFVHFIAQTIATTLKTNPSADLNQIAIKNPNLLLLLDDYAASRNAPALSENDFYWNETDRDKFSIEDELLAKFEEEATHISPPLTPDEMLNEFEEEAKKEDYIVRVFRLNASDPAILTTSTHSIMKELKIRVVPTYFDDSFIETKSSTFDGIKEPPMTHYALDDLCLSTLRPKW